MRTRRTAAAPEHLLELDDDTVVALNVFKERLEAMLKVVNTVLDMEDTFEAIQWTVDSPKTEFYKLDGVMDELHTLYKKWLDLME